MKNLGQAKLTVCYRRHLGPRFMDGDLTLSCDFAPEYRFESRAEWPEGVNFDGIIRDTVAEEFVRNHPLQLRKPPYDSPRVRTVMLWHRRLDRHPAHRWLRDIILSVIKSL